MIWRRVGKREYDKRCEASSSVPQKPKAREQFNEANGNRITFPYVVTKTLVDIYANETVFRNMSCIRWKLKCDLSTMKIIQTQSESFSSLATSAFSFWLHTENSLTCKFVTESIWLFNWCSNIILNTWRSRMIIVF